jgi:hypothetical protein
MLSAGADFTSLTVTIALCTDSWPANIHKVIYITADVGYILGL